MVGFVSPYEIARTLRSAGFEVLAPPLREGTAYVARATDFRGVLMRVVVDARTGAIRDATRIVPGPGRYGQLYGPPPPYDPANFDGSEPMLREPEMGPPPIASPLGAMPPTRPVMPMASVPPSVSLVRPPAAAHIIPLPRPRPAEFAARDGRASVIPSSPPSVPAPPALAPAAGGSDANAAVKSDPTAGAHISTEVITAAPPSPAVAPSTAAATTVPKKPAAVVPPLND